VLVRSEELALIVACDSGIAGWIQDGSFESALVVVDPGTGNLKRVFKGQAGPPPSRPAM
jgi:hypothetical protein